jgi:plasmid stabilization system protein ParE
VKLAFREAAQGDVIRQYRYYLVTVQRPDVAARFRRAVQITTAQIRTHPAIAPRIGLADWPTLRRWPVRGFPEIRFYLEMVGSAVEVIRI